MVVVGCTTSPSIIERPGPDASISRLPEGSSDQIWASSDLRAVIVRPTFDESPAGVITRDSRTTLAILDPRRATWLMNARLTEQEGLELTARIQQLVIENSLLEQRKEGSELSVQLRLQPPVGESSLPIPGGKWRVLTKSISSWDHMVHLGIVDAEGETVVAEVAMDMVVARDLMHRLAAAVRSPAY